VPSLDLALRLRMIRRAACVRHALVFQMLSQITRDVAWALSSQESCGANGKLRRQAGLSVSR
jgi:hypothetical protein